MSVSTLLEAIWARELGVQSEIFKEFTGIALNKTPRYSYELVPPTGYVALILHRIVLAALPSTERGRPVTVLDSLTTTATTYGTAASLAIGASPRRFRLYEIVLDSSDFSRTNWQVTIGGIQQFTARLLRATTTLRFPSNQLGPAEVILVEAASTDGTSITAYAAISGVEFTPYEYQVYLYKRAESEEYNTYITDDILREGIPTWTYITKGTPFRLEIAKLYGREGETLQVHFQVTKVPSLEKLEEIKRLAVDIGVQQKLPLSPVTGRELARAGR